MLERLLLSLVGQNIRTLCKLHRKLLRPPFSFQNCTKMTKYEAFEKNVVSNRKLSSLRQSLVRSVTHEVSVYWGFWGWSTELDSRLPRLMAEGEELGSNLLHVGQGTPSSSSGCGSWKKARPRPQYRYSRAGIISGAGSAIEDRSARWRSCQPPAGRHPAPDRF